MEGRKQRKAECSVEGVKNSANQVIREGEISSRISSSLTESVLTASFFLIPTLRPVTLFFTSSLLSNFARAKTEMDEGL